MDEDEPNRPLLREYKGRVLTVKEVAEILRVDESTVRRYVELGYLVRLPIPGRVIRIRGSSVDRMLNGQ